MELVSGSRDAAVDVPIGEIRDILATVSRNGRLRSGGH
jgi:hypothetical protein